jgi:transaldolase
MTNPILQLKAHGQSVWYDNIDRAQLLSGLFQRLIDEDGIVGTTANPTIFEQSISKGTAYDEQVRQLIQEDKSTNEIYEALVMTDVRLVADKLRPVYEQTNKQDGYVSLEISPDLSYDTEAMLAEARHFWNTVDRPNLLVKIPATPAGIPAIRQALSEGININITLIFALDNYRQVVEAYLSALEERGAKDQDISHIASVARSEERRVGKECS